MVVMVRLALLLFMWTLLWVSGQSMSTEFACLVAVSHTYIGMLLQGIRVCAA